MKGFILEDNLEGQRCTISTISTAYHFVGSKLRVDISSEKRGQQKMGALKWWIDAPLVTCIGASRKFHAKCVCCFLLLLLFFLMIEKSSFCKL